LDDAIAIARSENRYPRLVTLDGEMVSSSGAVTGGRTRHESRGMLGRSAEIEELEEKTRQSGEHIQKLAARAQALTEQMQQADRDAKDCARQESELHRELGQIGVRIARLSTDWDNVGQSLEDLEGQRQKLAEQRAEFEAKRTAAAERAENMETDDEALQQELNAAREAAEQARSDRDAHGARLNEIRMEQASLRQTLVQLQRDLERETKNREEALSQAQQRAEFLDRFSEQQVELKEKIETHTKETAQLAHDREDAQARAAESANRRQELLDETDEVDAKMREVREVVRQKQGEVHKLELDLRSDEDRLQFFNERIAEEYNIRLAELTEEQVGTDEYDEETRDKLVTDLRERIQRMGDVNLMAIEEYEAMDQRHAFLTGQCDDLRKAREALVGVIARSDKRIREMFLETFEAIANHFREFFRILFNGGQARVYLVDENDPLESGIEIEARPPGKKPTSISLLSGGESAMTAIALLVSILKAKPTPFCVLDEVDAPLDDANIGRFLDIIDEFSKDTQFVVITHSKRTMARADVMYGVTMQERGVSQIISAKLEDMRDEGESAA
jgi:chromosome segregation protein